jgi:hypothetical protein
VLLGSCFCCDLGLTFLCSLQHLIEICTQVANEWDSLPVHTRCPPLFFHCFLCLWPVSCAPYVHRVNRHADIYTYIDYISGSVELQKDWVPAALVCTVATSHCMPCARTCEQKNKDPGAAFSTNFASVMRILVNITFLFDACKYPQHSRWVPHAQPLSIVGGRETRQAPTHMQACSPLPALRDEVPQQQEEEGAAANEAERQLLGIAASGLRVKPFAPHHMRLAFYALCVFALAHIMTLPTQHQAAHAVSQQREVESPHPEAQPFVGARADTDRVQVQHHSRDPNQSRYPTAQLCQP